MLKVLRKIDADGCIVAFKGVAKDDMQEIRVTEEDVEREARTLEMLLHKQVIKFIRMYESEDELGVLWSGPKADRSRG